MRFTSSCSALVVLALAGRARAEDATLELSPRVAATFTNGQKTLETGLEWAFAEAVTPPSSVEQPGSGSVPARTIGRAYASLAVPFDEGKVVRLDKDSATWNIVVGGDLGRRAAHSEGDGNASRDRIGVELSAGHAKFGFYPDGGATKETQKHWSVAGTLSAIHIHEVQGDTYAPQLSVTYDRSYQAAPAVGIVTPATADLPALVTSTAPIREPGVAPSLTARVACPIALFPTTQFLIGPSVSHAFSGADRAYSPFGGDAGRLAGELWIYYFPKIESGKGVRLGVAPFASVRTYGDDGDDRYTYGALAELRITTEIYAY